MTNRKVAGDKGDVTDEAQRLAMKLSKLLVGDSHLGFQGVDLAFETQYQRPAPLLSVTRNDPTESVEHTITIRFTTWRKKRKARV